MSKYSRRDSLKVLTAFSAASVATDSAAADKVASGSSTASVTSQHQSQWHRHHNRIFLGGEYWANPMENWRIVDGAAECQSRGGNRNIHLITHLMTKPESGFEMSVTVTQVEAGKTDDGVGFIVGAASELNETKSNCFSKKGIRIGIQNGELVMGRKRKDAKLPDAFEKVSLQLVGEGAGDGKVRLTLKATSQDGTSLGQIENTVETAMLLGNVALVNNFDVKTRNAQGARYRFEDWQVSGDGFSIDQDAKFGPLMWTMYTLSDSRSDEGFVLKLSALTAPMGEQDNDEVELQVRRGERWESLGKAKLDHDAWTAVFRIPNWDPNEDVDYQVVYIESHAEGEETFHDWTGIIKANPVGRPVKFAPMTCQNDYGFPYKPVCDNLLRLDPDLLYFSGDQIYEGHGGYGIIREPAEPAIVNYLRKYYQFGWAFREAMRNSPTVCIPDDHDVFQGNIWGEGGAPMFTGDGKDRGASSKGGYREPVRMVNAVHLSCAGHHPEPFDPTPAKQDMSVYYGDMVYGDVSFAILGDRQFKSGPDRVETGSGRADHVFDREMDTTALDKPGLELLGERQESFLEAWSKDWRGARMKVLLSQTVFAGVATHHGRYDGFLAADLDSGGWPQTPRNRAIDIIRESKALHVNGDQHLTSLCQYGVDHQRDSNWSFCTPAIAAGYPRWWRPDEMDMPHTNRPFHDIDHTGEYVDGFQNKVFVYAVGNPEVGKAPNRYDRAHEKGSGFGYVLIDPETQTYEIHSYRFLINVLDESPDNEFPGWPVTIHADDNAGQRRLFNGKDLSGWHGRVHFDPAKLEAMSDEDRKNQIDAWTEEAKQHWSVEDGVLINDGKGPYLTTNEEFEDFELEIDYKTVARADSGIYLKGTPQVQIWDYTDENKFKLGADLGSGGLWNNSAGAPGKDPLVLADKPFGEWNRFKIRQVGARTSIWLNGKPVVDNAIMENYWKRDEPLRRRGPIQLQTHGGEIQWRNIVLRPLESEIANAQLADRANDGFNSLFDGKTLEGWIGAVDDYEVTPEGTIRCRPKRGGNLLTKDQYGDFIVRLQFRLPPGGNNGLAIRSPGSGNPAYNAMCELQVLDSEHPKYANLDDRQYHGSAYGMAAAKRGYLRPTGEWNFQEVRVVGSTIQVELNGNLILNTDLASATDFMAGSAHPGKDRTEGHFGFAGHSDPVEFRAIEMKAL